MLSRRSVLAVVVACSSLPLHAEDPKATPGKDKLKGTWRVVATEFDGNATNADALKDRELVFEDGAFKVIVGGSTKRTLQFKVDSTKTPGHIDITNAGTLESSRGIYSVEKDELKLCYGEPGAERPTEFTSPTGKRLYLIRLKRAP